MVRVGASLYLRDVRVLTRFPGDIKALLGVSEMEAACWRLDFAGNDFNFTHKPGHTYRRSDGSTARVYTIDEILQDIPRFQHGKTPDETIANYIRGLST
jgi:hypothetical protein